MDEQFLKRLPALQAHVIKSTASGELAQAINLLERIAPLSYDNPVIGQAFRDHTEGHMSQFLPISEAKIEDRTYIDQLKKRAYTLDHKDIKIVSESDIDPQLNEDQLGLLDKIHYELGAYLREHFREPYGFTVFVNKQTGGLSVALTGKYLNLNNKLTGEWMSKWTVQNGQINATITANSHYFETGNAQLTRTQNINEAFNLDTDPAKAAKALVQLIKRKENKLQQQLSDNYEKTSQRVFKALRRAIPATGMQMNWDIHAHNFMETLSQRK